MLDLYLNGTATSQAQLDEVSSDISDRYRVTCSNGFFEFISVCSAPGQGWQWSSMEPNRAANRANGALNGVNRY